jgi:hypothetical protein
VPALDAFSFVPFERGDFKGFFATRGIVKAIKSLFYGSSHTSDHFAFWFGVRLCRVDSISPAESLQFGPASVPLIERSDG